MSKSPVVGASLRFFGKHHLFCNFLRILVTFIEKALKSYRKVALTSKKREEALKTSEQW